jgi:hypothetical protein
MHSIRTYLLRAPAGPAATGSAQGDAALDRRLSAAGPLSGTLPASPESTFSAPETAYARWSSRHSQSAIWAARDHGQHGANDRASLIKSLLPVGMAGFEPAASCSQTRFIRPPDVALCRPMWLLAAAMLARRRPMWLGACACWLPLRLPNLAPVHARQKGAVQVRADWLGERWPGPDFASAASAWDTDGSSWFCFALSAARV